MTPNGELSLLALHRADAVSRDCEDDDRDDDDEDEDETENPDQRFARQTAVLAGHVVAL